MKTKNQIVTLMVESGIIQDVKAPKGITVIIYDYDIDGYDADRLSKGPDGENCVKEVWEGK